MSTSILFTGGTIIAFDREAQALQIIRNGSLLVQGDIIAGVYAAGTAPSELPPNTETVDVTGKIITPGFIDTHRHGWQTAFKTLGPDISLAEYMWRYSSPAAAGSLTPEDVHVGQLTGLYEALNAGVTTTLDHAHSTWSPECMEAGFKASLDSGARVYYAYAFTNGIQSFPVTQQLENYAVLAQDPALAASPTILCVAYDGWMAPNTEADTQAVIELIKQNNVPVVTTHSLGGPWGFTNSPEDLNTLGLLKSATAYVFSHASFLTFAGATILRQTNQFVSITPESEMHYGHGNSNSHLIQDQAALGVDTHFTFSSDILTQARMWLQAVRYRLYDAVLSVWKLPRSTPMKVADSFLLATRNGARALRRDDLGIIAQGAKADLVFWDGDSPSLLGWVDPVAAVMLHASVGDIKHVLVDGKWKKRDGALVVDDYAAVKKRFLASAKRIQQAWSERLPADLGDAFITGTPYAATAAVTSDPRK